MTEQEIRQIKNPMHRDEHTNVKRVEVEPEETQRSVTYQAPTPEMQEYLQRSVIDPMQRAYGINPDTGAVTPFEALGYNPEDERKRRAAEMALNDRKRKENAWYNALAVLGDSVAAAIGGNVWQRQPNRIGAQANVANQQLIAEQKAEDINNAAIIRNAGAKFAEDVQRVLKPYITKTTSTNKTGGSRMETTSFGPQNGYDTRSYVLKSGDSDSRGGKGSYKIVKLAVQDKNGKVLRYNNLTVPKEKADAYAIKLATTLQKRFNEGRLQETMDNLIASGIYNPAANDPLKKWNYDALLRYGYAFGNDGLRSEMEDLWNSSEEHKNDKKNGSKPLVLESASPGGYWQGVQDDDEYDD